MSGPEIVQEIKRRGLTSRELAMQISINSRAIQRWLSGERRIPARWIPALERFLKTGLVEPGRDAFGYFGDRHFDGGLRRDGTHILVKGSMVHPRT